MKMNEYIIYETSIKQELTTIYEKSKDWIKKKKGRITEEKKPYYISAQGYYDAWNFSPAGNTILIKFYK